MSATVNIIFSDNRGVVLIKDDQVEMSVKDNTLSPQEFAFVACINSLATKLRNGHFIDFDFNIKDFQSLNEIVKLEWLPRSGNLKDHGPTTKRYHYCDSVEAAMKEQRTFTCPRSVYVQLPKNRTPAWLADFMGSKDASSNL